MKDFIKFLVAIGVVFVLFLVFWFIVRPALTPSVEVPQITVTHGETADEANGDSNTPEETGMTVDSTSWFAIDGDFSSGSDRDMYWVAVNVPESALETKEADEPEEGEEPQPPEVVYNLEVITLNDGVPVQAFLNMNNFPLTIATYRADGSVITNHLRAALGGGIEISAETARMRVQANANDNHGSGYDYTIIFK